MPVTSKKPAFTPARAVIPNKSNRIGLLSLRTGFYDLLFWRQCICRECACRRALYEPCADAAHYQRDQSRLLQIRGENRGVLV